MIYIYRFFYQIAKTLLIVIFPFVDKKTQKWIQLRSAFQTEQYKNLQLKNSMWIHASSGEIEYAKSVISELKKSRPDSLIVVTYFSTSAEKLFENIKSQVDYFIPVPWDDVYSLRLLIKKISPSILVISRTDLWPEMIQQAAVQKIPLILISYYPSLQGWSSFYLRGLLRKFDLISCVDEGVRADVQRLVKDPRVKIESHGDTRFDQVLGRLEKPARLNLKSSRPIITFGSTWPEDEEQLFPLVAEILADQNRIVLAPHDVTPLNIKRLTNWLEQNKFTYQKLSGVTADVDLESSIFLIDQIGYLADAYRFSEWAFVGGSYKSRVHSVMEPLCCGLPVLVGPFYKNNPEALKYSRSAEKEFVFVCAGSEELRQRYQSLAKNAQNLRPQIQNEMQKNKGASTRLAQLILDRIPKRLDS